MAAAAHMSSRISREGDGLGGSGNRLLDGRDPSRFWMFVISGTHICGSTKLRDSINEFGEVDLDHHIPDTLADRGARGKASAVRGDLDEVDDRVNDSSRRENDGGIPQQDCKMGSKSGERVAHGADENDRDVGSKSPAYAPTRAASSTVGRCRRE